MVIINNITNIIGKNRDKNVIFNLYSHKVIMWSDVAKQKQNALLINRSTVANVIV